MREQPNTAGLSLAIGLCLLLFAVGARLLVWQNNKSEASGALSGVTLQYKNEARVLLNGEFKTFLTGPNPPGNAEILAHPPGYSILLAGILGIFGESGAVRIIQLLLNSLAPLAVFFIALKLFDFQVAAIAGFLVAVSPQISYNSVLLLPDALAVLPILLALYALIKAVEKPRLIYAILCGASLGVSCWLRANALLLPVFLAVLSWFLLSKEIRLRFALTLTAIFVLVIAPITIRNYAVFHSFIPLGLGTGINLVEGIADYDKEGRFGLPATDTGIHQMEVQLYHCPDYIDSHYSPDGIARERARTKMALRVIRAHPFWYASVVARRATMIMRLERVPAIAAQKNEGEPPSAFFYYLNIPLRLLQKLFITALFLPLFIAGAVLLYCERQPGKLLILLTVPLYYVCVQSIIHTEYRYVLAVQHFVLLLAAVALCRLADKLKGRLAAP